MSKRFSAILLVICIIYVECQPIFNVKDITLETNVSCGDVINATVDESVFFSYYQLNINGLYDVRFDDCYGADIAIFITDHSGMDISSLYCNEHGDFCGFGCQNAGNWIWGENFTIPMMENGIYYIKIEPYEFDKNYIVKINCNSLTVQPTSFFTTSVTSVTSVYEFLDIEDCTYHSNATYNSILSSQLIFDSMSIENSSIEIQFYIQLNDYCNSSLCNIFYIAIGNNEHIGGLSLSINGDEDYFEISIPNEYGYKDIYRLPNAKYLLPVDGQYHYIYMDYQFNLDKYTHNHNWIWIDDITFYYYSTADWNIDRHDVYQFYINSPYNDSFPLNASINDLCVKTMDSRVSRHSEIYGCGDLFFVTDYDAIYTLNLSNVDHVYVDACHDNVAYVSCSEMNLFDENGTETRLIPYDDHCRCHQTLSNSSNLYTLQITEYDNDLTIAVSIGCGIDECDHCIEEMSCNTTYKGALPDDRNIIYYFFHHINNGSTVIFDSCGSVYDTYLYLYDINMTLLFESDDDGFCGLQAQMVLTELATGKYIVGISTFKPERDREDLDWKMEVTCGRNININMSRESEAYILLKYGLRYHIGSDATHWTTSQTFCEKQHQSTLGTIINEGDKNESLQVIVPVIKDFMESVDSEQQTECCLSDKGFI